jgi:hypothetical protein
LRAAGYEMVASTEKKMQKEEFLVSQKSGD